MPLSDYLVTDDLTVILGLAAAGLFLLHNLYKPQSLVHPILLGRQSDVARVRNPGESAIYRNYTTGMMGRFPVRPSKEQLVLKDLVRPDLDNPRTLWSTKITNPELSNRVTAFGSALIKLAGLVPEESNVLLLLNDGLEFIIADLALSSHSIASFTLSSISLLSPVLDSHPPSAIITHAEFLPHLLELVYDTHEGSHHTIIVVGEYSSKVAQGLQARILNFEDLERQGAQLEAVQPSTPDPKQVFTVSFYTTPTGGIGGAQLTHENITAGVTAIRALFPTSGALSSLDTMVSCHTLSTAFGRAVAYTAIYEGSNFATMSSSRIINTGSATRQDLSDLKSADSYPIPSPTVLFIHPSHLSVLTGAIIERARSSGLLYTLAWRHKLASILEGFITKQSLWDRLVFDHARVAVLGNGAGTVRTVVVSGGDLEGQALTPSRIALSIPLVNAYTHSLVAGPVLASHAHDLQTFATEVPTEASSAADNYAFTCLAAVGSPAINVEAKLHSVNDDAIENGADPVGSLWLRGPSVGTLLHAEDSEEGDNSGWVEAGQRAKVSPNGTFKVVSSK